MADCRTVGHCTSAFEIVLNMALPRINPDPGLRGNWGPSHAEVLRSSSRVLDLWGRNA